MNTLQCAYRGKADEKKRTLIRVAAKTATDVHASHELS
jgi:hypothetical protein